jgi:hypothetical protein
MGFTATVLEKNFWGGKWVSWGSYVSASGSAGGDIDTTLDYVEGLILQPYGTTVSANPSVVNETFPLDDAVTIVTPANESGLWFAWGRCSA